MNRNGFLCLVLAVLPALFFASCTKTDPKVTTGTDSVVTTVPADTIYFIRSITNSFYDSTGTLYDSNTEYYVYDTIHRRVSLLNPNTQLTTNPFFDYADSVEFFYSDAGLLTRVVRHEASYGNAGATYSVDYSYDAAGTVKQGVLTSYGGDTYTVRYNKASLSTGGYALLWTTPLFLPADSNYMETFRVYFDERNRVVRYDIPFGNLLQTTDSLQYDAAGNVSSFLQTDYFYNTEPFTLPDSSYTYERFRFLTHDTIGHQLFDFQQKLWNGIGFISDVISFSMQETDATFTEASQYNRFPALTFSESYQSQGVKTDHTYQTAPEYDSLKRLTKYSLYNNRDGSPV